jgi:hypothetical protein
MAEREGLPRTSMYSALPASFAVQICSRHIFRTRRASRPPYSILSQPAHGTGFKKMAEREGFEPSMELLTPYSLSRGAPSASRPPLLVATLHSRPWRSHIAPITPRPNIPVEALAGKSIHWIDFSFRLALSATLQLHVLQPQGRASIVMILSSASCFAINPDVYPVLRPPGRHLDAFGTHSLFYFPPNSTRL